MPSQRQNMVNNIPAPGESASGGQGTLGRDTNTLQQSFPFSPLYTVTKGAIAGGAGFDEDTKSFYKNEVLDGVRSFGYGINNFDADYADAPDVSRTYRGTTSDGTLSKESIAAAKDVTAPVGSEYWPMPKPSDIGGTAGQSYEFDNADAGYGSGVGGTGPDANPSNTSSIISSENPLEPSTYGTSS